MCGPGTTNRELWESEHLKHSKHREPNVKHKLITVALPRSTNGKQLTFYVSLSWSRCHAKECSWAIIIYQPYGQPKRENKPKSWVHESSARLSERKSYVIKTEI